MRLVVGLLLLTASASAQDAEAIADSLFYASLEASRAALVGHTSLAASGPEGTIYYRIDAAGNARCRLVARDPAFNNLGEVFCLSVATADEWLDNGSGAGSDIGTLESRSDVWEGAPAHVISLQGLDSDSFDEMEMWLDAESLVVRRIWVVGRLAFGTEPAELEVRYDDVRIEAGVPFPRRLRFRFLDVRSMLEGVLPPGASFHDVYADALARHKANPTPDGEVGLGMIKAAIAGVPYEIAFPVGTVRLDEPLPEGLFDDEGGRGRIGM